VRVWNRDFPHRGTYRKAKDGFLPLGGSATPLTSHLSGLAGRPGSTAAMTACRARRASPYAAMNGRRASLWASPRRLGGGSTQQRDGSERGDMTEQIPSAGRELIDIHNRESAEVAALVREMTAMVARLGRETREMRQEVARIRTRAAARTAAAEPSSAPRLPGAIPDAPR
jgi:hypothetical protein